MHQQQHSTLTPPPIRTKPTFEERLDRKRKRMSLRQAADSILPPCMVLLTDLPIQAVHNGMLRRIFSIGYLDENSKVYARHIEYFHTVPDDIQLRWAMDDFSTVLRCAGFKVGVAHA